eukprot:scaffold229248_cov35-Tisochrysis_lutea.AAC.2
MWQQIHRVGLDKSCLLQSGGRGDGLCRNLFFGRIALHDKNANGSGENERAGITTRAQLHHLEEGHVVKCTT